MVAGGAVWRCVAKRRVAVELVLSVYLLCFCSIRL